MRNFQKCLCCGKPLKQNSQTSRWHNACIKSFFGTSEIPEISFSHSNLEFLAVKSTNKGFTIPGVQKKLSLHLCSDGNTPKLTLIDFPNGYILKPQVDEFVALPEAEHLVMCMAEKVGITTVPHALIEQRGKLAYITKRIDRLIDSNSVKIFAMEDFCQLDNRLTQDKYKGSYERCSKIIKQYSSRSLFDTTELYMRLVFSFVVGNSDMHLKNFSLIEPIEHSGKYILSPAYDLLPVNVIMPEDNEQMALALNGKKQNIRRKDFLIYAENCGLMKNVAENMMARIVSMVPTFLSMCEESLLPDSIKQSFLSLLQERSLLLTKN